MRTDDYTIQIPPGALMPADPVDRMVVIDQRIDANEADALRARWQFGREMLAARDGAGRLPNGYLAMLVERTGKSRRELSYRAQFAATFQTEDELCNALHNQETSA